MGQKKKTPMRRCIVSKEMKPKDNLFRIVRTPEGDVLYDPTGKKSGRGTYLSKNKEIIQRAQGQNILQKQLKTAVDHSVYDELLAILEMNDD